jgi:predicted permease
MGNLVTFRIAPAMNGYTDERVVPFYEELLDRVRSVPAVKHAGYASVSLLSGDEWDSTMSVEGHTSKDGEDMQAFMNSLSPGYFATMGIPVLEGRDFDRRDSATEAKVCIVNRKFARHFFGGKSPIGRHVGWGGGPKTKLNIEIVGMVEDSLYEGPKEGVRRQVFIPHWGDNSVAYYVRTDQDPSSALTALRAQVKKLDASMPVFEMKTLQAQLDQTLLTERLIAMLSAGFGALATLLASIGLYGLMAFVVARRTKEIGVRMALGAQPGNVLWLVMREVLILFAIGLAIGVPAAFAVGRYVAAQLYGVQANDPWVAGIALILLAVVAALAGLIPAKRASRIDPLLALRYE